MPIPPRATPPPCSGVRCRRCGPRWRRSGRRLRRPRDSAPPSTTPVPARACSGLATTVRVPDAVDASPAALLAVVRFVREAVWNVVKHAEATRVDVTVTLAGGSVRVVVHDDGAGFDPAVVVEGGRTGHLGTTLLREVAEDTGGSLLLRTAPGAGTTWDLEVPVDAEALR
ncbi:sensor histidine kinase [Curtobacterium flaccumfaciens]|uniref:sensor histidine kinase n=1 Tax=Curtobacterium flaccumfaciens TaxID=2035 RepID=UPI0036F29058